MVGHNFLGTGGSLIAEKFLIALKWDVHPTKVLETKAQPAFRLQAQVMHWFGTKNHPSQSNGSVIIPTATNATISISHCQSKPS